MQVMDKEPEFLKKMRNPDSFLSGRFQYNGEC